MVGVLSYMMQPMFDDVFVQGNTGALKWVSLAFLVIFAVRGGAGVVQKVLLVRISQETAAHLRLDLLNRLIRQDTSFHQTHPPGFLIQRVQMDVSAVNHVWQVIITGAGRDAVSLVVLIGRCHQCRFRLDRRHADRGSGAVAAHRGGAALCAQKGRSGPRPWRRSVDPTGRDLSRHRPDQAEQPLERYQVDRFNGHMRGFRPIRGARQPLAPPRSPG